MDGVPSTIRCTQRCGQFGTKTRSKDLTFQRRQVKHQHRIGQSFPLARNSLRWGSANEVLLVKLVQEFAQLPDGYLTLSVQAVAFRDKIEHPCKRCSLRARERHGNSQFGMRRQVCG